MCKICQNTGFSLTRIFPTQSKTPMGKYESKKTHVFYAVQVFFRDLQLSQEICRSPKKTTRKTFSLNTKNLRIVALG